jgi:peptidoglycan/xylan/chitin deacetylase (PgdA/CDA1 family)
MSARDLIAGPALAGLSLWRRIVPAAAGTFRILLFHDVTGGQVDRFAALLDHLALNGGFIAPAEAEARLAGAVDNRRIPWLVTFDDGFASNHHIATTVLARHGIKALFFVCPGLMDLPAEAQRAAVARAFFAGHADPAAAAARTPLMGWDKLAELAAMGHVIGAHSMTHRPLAGMKAAALGDELAGSRHRLAAMLGVAATWFAWPYGDIGSIDGPALAAIARQYRFCRSGVRGANGPGTHPLALCADHVDLDAAPAWQKLAALGGLDGRYAGARARLDSLARYAAHSAPP